MHSLLLLGGLAASLDDQQRFSAFSKG